MGDFRWRHFRGGSHRDCRAALPCVFTLGLGLASSYVAAAKPLLDVRQSGRIFHAAVCPGPDAPGFARCHARIITDRQGNPFAVDARANLTPSGYGPSALQSAYNVNPASGAPTSVIAIVDAYGYTNAEADLAVYRSTYGLPACTVANGCFAKYNQNGVKGSYPRQNTGWSQETALDLDMASAMCPNCHIIIVEANSSSLADLAAAVNRAAILGARVISNSYGGGEAGSTTYESAYNHPGVAITASSGVDRRAKGTPLAG